MDEERNQKELFEFQEQKKPFSKLANMLPKPDFEGKVALSLTLEKIVFVFIGIVMVMVIVFALGVEIGKSRGTAAEVAKAPQTPQVVRPVAPIAVTQVVAPAQKGFFNTAPAAPQARPSQSSSGTVSPKSVATAQKAGTRQPDSPAVKPYTIVAATFTKKETAQAAATFLTKEGFNASVVYGDPYYRVCVGAYADTNSAQVQRDLAKARRIYKDAFIRAR